MADVGTGSSHATQPLRLRELTWFFADSEWPKEELAILDESGRLAEPHAP